jgi:ribosomal protein S18 acetylase RimI-like enzyme
MHLRPLQASDRTALAALLSEIEQFKPDEVAVALELIDGALAGESSGYHVIVALDDQPCGYVCFGPTPMTQATWDLYWIAVSPKLQGRGTGRALYDAFVECIRARGGRQVRIETSSQESYAKTGGFYERLGFEIAGRLRDFYAPSDDLLLFYRHIG